MNRWIGRVAVVTGASSGIGQAIASALVGQGVKVAALARRLDKLKVLEAELLKNQKGEIKAMQCDLTKEDDILKAFKRIDDVWGPIHIVVNNAGILSTGTLLDGRAKDWKAMIETNMLAPSICTKEGIKSMKAHNVDDGHIININSLSGHKVLINPAVAVYSAAKHALRIQTEYLRNQLAEEKSQIRVTSLSPGLVKTEMTSRFNIEKAPYLLPSDISDAVIYILSTPPRVNVSELLITPVGEIA